MKNETPVAATETEVAEIATAPKAPPKTATITLTAPGGTMQIVAERRADDSARVYVITTDTEKKSARGMTTNHPTFEAAKAASEKLAAKAAKLGWQRTVRRVAFVPKPDAFNTLPLPTAAPAPTVPAAPKGKK